VTTASIISCLLGRVKSFVDLVAHWKIRHHMTGDMTTDNNVLLCT